MKTFILSCLMTGMFLMSLSCSKNDDKPATKTSVVAQWNLIKAVYADPNGGGSSVEPYDEGSYLRFSDNGICYSFVDGDSYASNWHYIDNNTGLLIDNSSGFDANDSGYAIQGLTDSTMILHSKELIDYQNQDLYLTK